MAGRFPAWPPAGILAGWRGLGRFWLAALAVAATGAGVLQALGPPVTAAAVKFVRADPHPAVQAAPEMKAPALALPSKRPPRLFSGADPALLEPYEGDPNLALPRIGADGRLPMAVYSSKFDRTDKRPRVGILVAGIGMSQADSLAAVKNLPGAITLAISPYAASTDDLLAATRSAAHEYLLSIPMEPEGYPVNDPDDHHALMTSLSPSENLTRLRWALSRIAGYAGVTDALGPMHGERLAGMPDQLDSVLREIAHRGLLFVDARTGRPPLAQAWNRSADILIDEDPANAAALDQRLETLTHIALDKGSALGIVSVPRPVTLERVAAWTNSLAARGVVLVPVSALAMPPAPQEQDR